MPQFHYAVSPSLVNLAHCFIVMVVGDVQQHCRNGFVFDLVNFILFEKCVLHNQQSVFLFDFFQIRCGKVFGLLGKFFDKGLQCRIVTP